MINLSKIHDLQWYDSQLILFKNIMDFFKKIIIVRFLNAPPGTENLCLFNGAKTKLLLNNTYNPCDPGSSLNTCYHRAKNFSE